MQCHELKAAGHTIIIYTDRGMRAAGASCSLPTSPTCSSPSGPPSPTVTAAVAAQRERESVEATLARFGVPYDELYFGKPVADVVVDDCSVNPLGGHVRRDIGWRESGRNGEDGSMVSARAFNLIGAWPVDPQCSRPSVCSCALSAPLRFWQRATASIQAVLFVWLTSGGGEGVAHDRGARRRRAQDGATARARGRGALYTRPLT